MTTLIERKREYETNDGTKESTQYITTVPIGLVEAMGWEGGDELDWSVESGSKLGVQKEK